jgi:hypothetical protein
MLAQLFARSGVLVDTVTIARYAEVISWNGKYYSLQSGRYVEGDLLTATATEIAPVTATAGGIVGNQVVFR